MPESSFESTQAAACVAEPGQQSQLLLVSTQDLTLAVLLESYGGHSGGAVDLEEERAALEIIQQVHASLAAELWDVVDNNGELGRVWNVAM